MQQDIDVSTINLARAV